MSRGEGLRILVAHNVPAARRGGMSRLMGFIHDRVSAAGHQVDFFTADDVSPATRGRWGRFLFPLAVRRRAVQAARAGAPYDIVNVHEPASAAIAVARRAAGNPAVVVTSHGVEVRAWELALEEGSLGRGGPGRWNRFVYPLTALTQCRAGLSRADRIFCLNTQDQRFLNERFAIPADRITPIGPGVDAVYSTAAATRSYAGASRLLFAATWRKNKGIQDLIPAFTTLAARYPSLTLTVLGGGVPEATVQAAFLDALRERVRCVTTADDAANAKAYADHDLFVLPSLFEGTPLTLLEAMASGLPIVTTATCGMLDVMQDDRNGLLIPIRSPDAIVAGLERLLTDPDLRARLGRTARVDALARHTWDHAAEPVLRVYGAIAAARSRG